MTLRHINTEREVRCDFCNQNKRKWKEDALGQLYRMVKKLPNGLLKCVECQQGLVVKAKRTGLVKPAKGILIPDGCAARS